MTNQRKRRVKGTSPFNDGRCDICGDQECVELMEYGPYAGSFLCINCTEGLEEEGLDE